MQINHTIYGDLSNQNIIIIHGLFGSSENWRSIAKQLSKNYGIICIDCRNHGHSFHHDSMTYEEMANDVIQLLNHLEISSTHIIGHSMGGKVAMTITLMFSDYIQKQIIVDIAPKSYPPHHQQIINSLKGIRLTQYKLRSDVSEHLKTSIPDINLRSFLLKNIQTIPGGSLKWKINLNSIANNYKTIMDWPKSMNKKESLTPTLFINGNQSNYLIEPDKAQISQLFKKTEFISLNASHWVHAEKPTEFLNSVSSFLEKS